MTTNDPYDVFCFRCLAPLRKHQVAVTFHAHGIMWDDRTEGDIDLHGCKSCKQTLEDAIAQGTRGIVRRWEAIDEQVPIPSGEL